MVSIGDALTQPIAIPTSTLNTKSPHVTKSHKPMFLLLRGTSLKPSTHLRHLSQFFSTKTPFPDEPTAAYYDELISNAGHSEDYTKLHHLLNKRYKDGLFNTSNTFKFLENTDNLTHILQTLSNLDKGFARKNAFDCLIIHLSNSNHINESLHVIDTMIEKEVGVNAITFHPLLSNLSKQDLELGWRILEKMKSVGIHVGITSYNYLLSSACFRGDLNAAASILDVIMEEGLKVDSRTYDALVMGACRVGKVEGALMLLRKMEEERVAVLYSTHTHVIKSLLGLGCFEQALEFVMGFAGRDEGLDRENFGVLLSCLVKRRRVDEAKTVFEEMEKRGLVIGEKLRCRYNLLLEDIAS